MIAEVIVDILNSEVDRIFDYSILSNQQISVGERVLVPFGKRNIEGYVIALKEKSELAKEKLKNIIKPLDNFVAIKPEFIELMYFMCASYNTRKADVLRLFIPPAIRNNQSKEKIVKQISLAENFDLAKIKKNAKSQLEIVEYLKAKTSETSIELNKLFSSSALNGLIEKGIVEVTETVVYRNPYASEIEKKVVNLTDAQEKAKSVILNSVNKTILLKGVTGSGKTEVYLRCITEVLKQGKSAIMLVPEISLTPQMLKIFRSHFGEEVAILHSGLSAGERNDEWNKLRLGKSRVAIGARSCVFAPLENLGLIIIDEEHDGSYFSQTNPRYSTLEVAEFRAKFNNCNLVLGSATPSVETYFKAQNGKYLLVELPKRIGNVKMPELEIVDMGAELLSGNNSIFSKQMIYELSECVSQKNQAMIFLNRRGYSSYVLCKECGYIAKCDDCDANLVYHKEDNQLKCHYCSRRYHNLSECPNCHSKYIKQGVYGTEQVAFELQKIFKNVKILRMDFDTTKNKDGHTKILEEFEKSKPAILVGTQMIAKGHDFKDITFVGILDPDNGLYSPDYRSPERMFQLVTQVVGRAGRAGKPGKAILQTYSPKHYVYRLAKENNYQAFFERELNIRQTTCFPPFSKIVRIMSASENEDEARKQIAEINADIQTLKKEYVGQIVFAEAMKSPVKRMQKKFRYQILLRILSENSAEILKKVYNIVNIHSHSQNECFVELDPQNLN